MVKQTLQREAIRRVFEGIDRPLGIDDIVAQAQKHAPTINMATVYRNVNRLIEEEWLVRLDFPPFGTFYERAGKSHHHHFHCRGCNQLHELSGCGVQQANDLPKGFIVERHELFLFGLCSDCTPRDSRQPAGKRRSPSPLRRAATRR